MTSKELEVLKNMDIKSIDRKKLIDIDDIVIDDNMSKEDRITKFINDTQNPYCFKYKEYIVKSSFTTGGGSLEKYTERYLIDYINAKNNL